MKKYICIAAAIIMLQSCSNSVQPLPDEVHNIPLAKKITGEEAATLVNQIHLQPVTDTKNEIGYYESENGDAVIYITYCTDNNEAADFEKRMTEKISPANSVFIRGEYTRLFGKDVYRCYGMGKTHFVFRSDCKLYWISAETMWAKKFLEEYLNHIS